MTSAIIQAHQTAQATHSLAKNFGQTAAAIAALVISAAAPANAEMKTGGFWTSRVKTPEQPSQKIVDENPVLAKLLKFAALLDISSPNTASVATQVKAQSQLLKGVDERALFLRGAPITCVTSIHNAFHETAETLERFAKETPTASTELRMRAMLLAQELKEFPQNNTIALTGMETRAASAQQSFNQRVA